MAGRQTEYGLALEASSSSFNVYTKEDATTPQPRSTERVFISHRSLDKPIAAAIAGLLEELHLHYWFDRDDQDTQRAAALGMKGDLALVHAIDRGIRHSTRILGILSENTRLSWWVPYELGSARAVGIPASFLVQASLQIDSLPEFIRLSSLYWSLDELLRWITCLPGSPLNSTLKSPSTLTRNMLTSFIPLLPPEAQIRVLSQRAIEAIGELNNLETQQQLQLTSTTFDWLPTAGGFIRDLSYDILAPLAYYQLKEPQLVGEQRPILRLLYLSITQHNAIAKLDKLKYQPVTVNWRTDRYDDPSFHWLQGISETQLKERLRRFFTVLSISGSRRLATKEEFKAEFDRILARKGIGDRRTLGVLINPIMGYNHHDRPVFCRILAIQMMLHLRIMEPIDGSVSEQTIIAINTQPMRAFAEEYISNASINGQLSDDSIEQYLQATQVVAPVRIQYDDD